MSNQLIGDAESIYFETALDLVKQAGKLVRDAYDRSSNRDVFTKMSSTDLVTETDRNVESLLIDGLTAKFPNHKFIGEESAASGKKIELTDDPTWIIDPIDGTTNFVHRIPMLAVCVGLTIAKRLRIGIVYNPITNDLYTAIANQGAYKNGFRIYASKNEDIRQSIVGAQIGSDRQSQIVNSYMDNFRAMMVANSAQGQRAFGAASIHLVYVAEGAVDAYLEYGLHCWDVAAAGLIVIEAGGVLIDPSGAEFNLMSRRVLAASTHRLATTLSGMLTHAEFEHEG